MEMHQIRYFLAVAKTLNFTRAAELCNVTQPSLTRAIQKLEDEFGGLLFNRERAMTHLTELGRIVLPHLEQTFEAAETATSLAVSIGRAEVTPLVMGVAHGLSLPMLDELLASLAEALPGLALDLRLGSSEELLELSLKGGLDLLLITLPDDVHDRLVTWPLFETTYKIALGSGHPLADTGPLSLDEAVREPWIDCADDGTALWRSIVAGSGMEATFRHRVQSPVLALQLIARHMGLALVAADARGEGVVLADCAGIPLRRNIVLAAIAGRKRGRAADAFLRAARAREWPEAVPVQVAAFNAESAARTSAGSAR